MASKINYSCPNTGFEDIPKEIIASGRFKFPDIHTDAILMSELALSIREYKDDVFASVPFCLTVEADSLGGNIDLGNEHIGPRVKDYRYNTLSELLEIDFQSVINSGKRIGTVMEASKKFSSDVPVILNVNGIFTILSSLIDITTVYKAMRKNKNIVHAVLEKIKNFTLSFIKLGLENGVKVISYADPIGDITLIGPKMFNEFVLPITCETINGTLNMFDDSQIFHLCERMTNGLNKSEVVNIRKIEIQNVETYGEGMLKLLNDEGINFMGNNCIKRTSLKEPSGIVTIFDLKLLKKSIEV